MKFLVSKKQKKGEVLESVFTDKIFLKSKVKMKKGKLW